MTNIIYKFKNKKEKQFILKIIRKLNIREHSISSNNTRLNIIGYDWLWFWYPLGQNPPCCVIAGNNGEGISNDIKLHTCESFREWLALTIMENRKQKIK